MHANNQNIDQTAQPVCSVCIANYNGIEVIHECITSIMQQNFDLQVEIIVHDDASTDNSVEFIRTHFPNIVLIESKENVGFCVSNNRMVQKACGKYILLLNNDAALFPDALRTLYGYAETQKKPGILGLRQYNAKTGRLIDCGIMLDPFMNSIPNTNIDRTDVAMLMGACIWIPKKLWEMTGGFPEWFHTMHEDMYICCIARLLGFDVLVVPQSGYWHQVGWSLGGGKVVENRLATSVQRRFLSERNRLFVISLCYPVPFIYFVLPLQILLLILEGIILSIVKRKIIVKTIYLNSIAELWRKAEKIYRIRRETQAKCCITSWCFLSVFSLMPHKLRMLLKYGFPEVY
ncbi:MAG: glycosyltransferase family 2 protein [Desulfamplus sp.]|nr:glycosyltransferase family 2 protein [Desulfamplus sp.]